MSSPPKPSPPAFGFLTVLEPSEAGAVGGYLIVNAGGRPVEFHCTSPVKANRTQEILYGSTLKPYLYGEQIGQALTAKAKTETLLIFTDHADVTSLRAWRNEPVVLMLDEKSGDASAAQAMRLGEFSVALDRSQREDETIVREVWQRHLESFDLREPFQRVREALEEAHKSSRAAA